MALQSNIKPPARITNPASGLRGWLDQLWRAVDSLVRWRNSFNDRKPNDAFLRVKVCVTDDDGNTSEKDAYVVGYIARTPGD